MKRLKTLIWPLVGIVAVLWSVDLLYRKLIAEVARDPKVKALLDAGGLLEDIKNIALAIGQKLADIPLHAYLLAAASTVVAYWALAWYDRIALIHLNRQKGISWLYVSVCSFVTYAISHNIGVSVFSGGLVRYRAYSAKGLTAAEVAVLVALCSFTFAFGTILLTGIVFVLKPEILAPLAQIGSVFDIGPTVTRIFGVLMLAFCGLYTLGAWLHFKPMNFRSFELVYPRMPIVFRQYIAAPMELIGAAGIIYFALPAEANPSFLLVLGAFLLSFSAGLLSQVPGGVGVMEAVFLAIMPGIPSTAVFAALLVWRLFYLLIPMVISIPVILGFEHSQLGKATKGIKPPEKKPH
ncbi:MAG: YbhN family protein [Beijerinckiaceae bacterium]